jgi:hypothetical protein
LFSQRTPSQPFGCSLAGRPQGGKVLFFQGALKKDKAKLEPKTIQTIPQRKETNRMLSNQFFKFAREKPTNSHIQKQPKTISKTMFQHTFVRVAGPPRGEQG